MVDVSPCLTASRGEKGGLYMLPLNRRFDVKEMGKLLAISTRVAERLLAAVPSKVAVGRAFGNAQSVNVLERLLPPTLHSAGLVPDEAMDLWEHASNLASGMSEPPTNAWNFLEQVRGVDH